MAKIMVVAGGTWQCPIVKKAKELGNYVVCSNLYENSPAFEYADDGVVANVLDKEKNLEYAQQYGIEAVITDQTDISVPTVAYIAEKMNIKGISVDIAKRFTNKYLMRVYTEKAGFPSPKFKKVSSIEEAKDFFETLDIAVIKPLDSQSSRGIHIIREKNEIDQYYEDCVQYSNCEKSILIEEYIDGTEFTVDGIMTDSGYRVTAISEKDHFSFNPNVANRLLFTPTNDKYDYNKLRLVNEKMAFALGLPFGLTHAEYKYRDGDFYLIEIAARGGGTRISSDIVPIVSGIDTNAALINMALNNSVELIEGEKHEYAVLGFFDFEPGIITEISGVEEAKKMAGVRDVEIERKVGDVLENAQDDRSRCGYYIAYADSKAELEDIEKNIKSMVKVVTKK